MVLNREDLVTAKERDMWKEWFEARNQTVLYTNARLGKVAAPLCRARRPIVSCVGPFPHTRVCVHREDVCAYEGV